MNHGQGENSLMHHHRENSAMHHPVFRKSFLGYNLLGRLENSRGNINTADTFTWSCDASNRLYCNVFTICKFAYTSAS